MLWFFTKSSLLSDFGGEVKNIPFFPGISLSFCVEKGCLLSQVERCVLRRQLDESAALQAVCGALMAKEADVTKSPQVFWKRKFIMKKNKCAIKRGDNYVSFWEGRRIH